MAAPNLLDQLADTVARLKSSRCEARLDLIHKLKASFGEKFDDLDFFNYETGGFVKGAELREAQTGCEIFQAQGWDRSPDFGHEIFKCGCRQYDEQLRFVSPEGDPLSSTDYRVTLADGRTVSGTTDSGGKTKRIKNTNKEEPIEKVQFFSSQRTQPLCPINAIHSGKCIKELDLSGVTTTPENVGSSIKTVTVKGTARPLTSGEIAMARLVFKDSIDYSKVKVHKEEYLPFGLQDDYTAMTPNGEMYFNPGTGFKEDFSAEGTDFKMWFIHEMVHVWQYQLGYWVKLKGLGLAISGGYAGGSAYAYDSLSNDKKNLPDFNMEQQAEIISQYFGAKFLEAGEYYPKLPVIEDLLKQFLRTREMRIYCRSSLICLLVLAIPITACAAFRIKDADAVITLRGDRPCFSYPRDKEIQKTSYSFGGVSVSKAGSQGGVLWEIGISGQERKGIIEPDNHGTCIQYGIPHQGTTVKKAAEALLDDTPYFVVLRLSTSAGVTYNERRYLSYFCLSHNEKGDSIIESAGYDNTTSSWACLKQGKSPKRGFWQKLFGK